MTAKDFLKKLKEAVGDKPWPSSEVLKDQIGIAFEAEARNRIKSRKLGPIDERSAWAIKRELFAYGQALVGILGASVIDKMLFDRVMDGVILNHNAIQNKEKQERIALVKKKMAKERSAESGPAIPVEMGEGKAFTLGQAIGLE